MYVASANEIGGKGTESVENVKCGCLEIIKMDLSQLKKYK